MKTPEQEEAFFNAVKKSQQTNVNFLYNENEDTSGDKQSFREKETS